MILNYNQDFTFNGQKLSGISDVTFASNFGLSLKKSLGAKNFGFAKSEPAVGTLEFSRSLIYNDPVLQLTGDSSCSGQFSYNSINYSFHSGFLSNYQVSCLVGQIPSVSSSFQIFGEMKSGAINDIIVTHPSIYVPSPRSLTVQNSYFSSNRAISIDYSVSCQRDVRYSVNSIFPDNVSLLRPVNISASIVYNVKGFSAVDLNYFVREVSSPSFIIDIKDRTLSTSLMTLPVSNAQLTSQQIQGTVDSPLAVTLSYEGFSE